MKDQLLVIYARLYAHFGPQHWWPGRGAFDVVVGAILTQNTAWTNVEKAIANLTRARLMNPARMHHTPVARLARLVRPSGYYNLKAKKLKAFCACLFSKHRGSLTRLFTLDAAALRQELLQVYGIGPETADSIVLYAAHKPVFVIDAYTRRIFSRLGLAPDDAPYDDLQHLAAQNLPCDEQLFNEYHALLVALGKNYCTKRAPRCSACPLYVVCPSSGSSESQPVAASAGPD
jgi:endonuclease-3 related protein